MPTQEDFADFRRKLSEHFGGREGHLAWQLITLSETGQPADVTFYHRDPIFDVKVSNKIGIALMYGAGSGKLAELLSSIEFSDGSRASFRDIWTINPMPIQGISDAELESVDLADAEAKAGPAGETVRQMISETYKCKSRDEEDRVLRRFLAS